jgi:four helix bundle protein
MKENEHSPLSPIHSPLSPIHSPLSPIHSPLSRPNPVRDKSFAFALRVVKLAKYLQEEKREYVLSKQVLRSGTAVGALVREAEHAQSKADFINKMSIALKEANETDYWIDLLHQSDYITQESYDSIHPNIQELIKLLVSIVKSSKARTNP